MAKDLANTYTGLGADGVEGGLMNKNLNKIEKEAKLKKIEEN